MTAWQAAQQSERVQGDAKLAGNLEAAHMEGNTP